MSHAAPGGAVNSADSPLGDAVPRFELYAALRAIERAAADRPRLGEAARPTEEPLRVAQAPHVHFARTDLIAFAPRADGVPVLQQHSFGVFGPNGALPLHLTEYAHARQRQQGDPVLVDFVNAFQHRFAMLFYRAWADSEPVAQFDRPAEDRYREFVGALCGLGMPAARARDGVPDEAKLSRAAWFGGRPSADGLAAILADQFGLPVTVRSYVGEWLPIPADDRLRLGDAPASAAPAGLGTGATLGARSWQCQSTFEIGAGPLPLARFTDFLPGSADLAALSDLVRLYTRDEWSWQLRLWLHGTSVPRLALGTGARLGWTTWLGSRAPDAGAAGDVVVRPAAWRGAGAHLPTHMDLGSTHG